MTIASAPTRADEHKLYRFDVANWASPVPVEMATLTGHSVEFQRDAKQYMDRLANWFGNRLGKGQLELPISGNYHKEDPDRLALRAAHFADPATNIGIIVADGDFATTGTDYHKVAVIVPEYKEEEQDDGIVKVTMKLILGDVRAYVPLVGQTVA